VQALLRNSSRGSLYIGLGLDLIMCSVRFSTSAAIYHDRSGKHLRILGSAQSMGAPTGTVSFKGAKMGSIIPAPVSIYQCWKFVGPRGSCDLMWTWL